MPGALHDDIFMPLDGGPVGEPLDPRYIEGAIRLIQELKSGLAPIYPIPEMPTEEYQAYSLLLGPLFETYNLDHKDLESYQLWWNAKYGAPDLPTEYFIDAWIEHPNVAYALEIGQSYQLNPNQLGVLIYRNNVFSKGELPLYSDIFKNQWRYTLGANTQLSKDDRNVNLLISMSTPLNLRKHVFGR
jgi:hypothetical protein